MKLNRKNKKGFTIVELVIVIAVIGILSAILIPTFTNLTKNAREAAAKEEVANAYTAYIMDAADGSLHNDPSDSQDVITPVTQLGQDAITINRGDEWFVYNNGWTTEGATEKGSALSLGDYNGCTVYKNA